MKAVLEALLTAAIVLSLAVGLSTGAQAAPNFMPNDLSYWDDSAHWTTNYGPAYRDTLEKPENLVPCTGKFALCFTSGPQPLPCVPSKNGRSADCTCTAQYGLNFVLISAILNREVYRDTVAVCGADGSGCFDQVDKAPVCAAINSGALFKDADFISTFDPSAANAVKAILAGEPPLKCAKAPYAACMTAPCKQKADGSNPVCSCPVFTGVFQLPTVGAVCDLGDGLIPSSSFTPSTLNQ